MQPGIADQVDRAINRTMFGHIHKKQLGDTQAHNIGQAVGGAVLGRVIARGQNGINFAEMAQGAAE